MLHPDVLSSFSSELEKRAMDWRIPVGTSLVGAGTAAYLAGKQALPEFRQDTLMHDMDVMSDDVYKRRLTRKAIAVGGATAAGGIAGAAAPFVVSAVGTRLMNKAREQFTPMAAQARSAGRRHLETARGMAVEQASETAKSMGREFAGSAIEEAAKRSKEIEEITEKAVGGAARGARRGATGMSFRDLIFGVKG